MKDFFISYNKADREWAEWIAWQLVDAGFTVIIQAWDFRPGSNFMLEIQRSTKEAKRTIAVLSPDYLEASYTQPEWAAALGQDPKSDQRKLLPVRVRECQPEGLLSFIVYIDLVNKDEATGRTDLLDGVNPNCLRPKTPPRFPGRPQPSFPGDVLPRMSDGHVILPPVSDEAEESTTQVVTRGLFEESTKLPLGERTRFQREEAGNVKEPLPVTAPSDQLPDQPSALQEASPIDAPEVELLRGYLNVLLGEISYRTQRETLRNTPTSLSVFVPLQAEYDFPDVDRRVLYAEVEMDERQLRTLDPEHRRSERKKHEQQFRYPKAGQGEPLLEILQQHHKVVLLGDPGAGKTTQLRYLTWRLAEAIKAAPHRLLQALEQPNTLTDWRQPDIGPVRLPLFIRIAEYAEAREQAKTQLTLLDYLPVLFKKLHVPEAEKTLNLFQRLLESGLCYLLLDGLDEIIRHKDRQKIADSIQGFSNSPNYADNHFLVASRIVGYRPGLLGGDFGHYRICPLNPTQITDFLLKWYQKIGQLEFPASPTEELHRTAEQRVAEIHQAIQNTPGVSRLATNPLLLRILAIVHREKGDLPKQRVGIYERAAFTLLRDWNQMRDAAEPPVTEEASLALLRPLAYHIHTNNQSQLLEEEAARELLKAILAKDPQSFPLALQPDVYIKNFLDWVRKDTGLFVERGVGLYGFMHLTFEEYFTALHIVRVADENFQEIFERLHNPRWREPILLAVGHIDQHLGDKVSGVLRKILAAGSDYEDDLCRDLLMAAACASDSVNVENALLEEIARRLFSVYCNRPRAVRYLPLQKQVKSALLALKHGQGERGVELLERLLAERLNDHSDRQASLQALEIADWLEPCSPQVAEALAQCMHLGTRPRELWLKLTAAPATSADWEPYRTEPLLPHLLGAMWLYGWRDAIELSLKVSEVVLAPLSTEAFDSLLEDFAQSCEKLLAGLNDTKPMGKQQQEESLRELRALAQGLANYAERSNKWQWFGSIAQYLISNLDSIYAFGDLEGEQRYFRQLVKVFAHLGVKGSGGRTVRTERFQEWGNLIVKHAQDGATLAPSLVESAYSLRLNADPTTFRTDLQTAQDELANELLVNLQAAHDYETYNQTSLFLALTGVPETGARVVDIVLADAAEINSPRSAWAMQLLTTPLFHKRVNFTENQNQRLTQWLNDDASKAKLAAGILWSKSGLTTEQLGWCWSALKAPGKPLGAEVTDELESVAEVPGTAEFLALLEAGWQDERLRPTALELLRKVKWNGLATLQYALRWLASDDEEVRHLAALLVAREPASLLFPHVEYVAACLEKFKELLKPVTKITGDALSRSIPSNLELCWEIIKTTTDDQQWYEYLSYLASLESQQPRMAEILSAGLRSGSNERHLYTLALLFHRPALGRSFSSGLVSWVVQETTPPDEALLGLGALLQLETIPVEVIVWLRSLLISDHRQPVASWLHQVISAHNLDISASPPMLAAMLERPEPDLRLAAALLLLAADLPKMLTGALTEAARTTDDRTRQMATALLYETAKTLSSNGSTEAIQALADFHATPEIEKTGAWGTRSVTALHHVPHRNPYWLVRWLNQVRAGTPKQKEQAENLLTAWLNVDGASLHLLIQTLSDVEQSDEIRRAVIASLCASLATYTHLRSRVTLRAALLACLSDRDKQIRQRAAFALQWMEGEVEGVLRELLECAHTGRDFGTRSTALRSAGCLLHRQHVDEQEHKHLDQVRAFLSAPVKELRRVAACALARCYRGRADRPELLWAELGTQDEVLWAMIEATIDWDDWQYNESAPDAGSHGADVKQIAEWLNRQSKEDHKRYIETIVKELQQEVNLIKNEIQREPYKVFYTKWRRRQVLMAVLAKASESITFYEFIPGESATEDSLVERQRRLKPVVKLFAVLAEDPGTWVARLYAIKALGNLQQFDAEVAHAFFEACKDVTDVARETLRAVSNFKYFSENSLDHLIRAMRGDSLVAASNATQLLGQIGLHRSEEISPHRKRLADELAGLLHDPRSGRIVYDLSDHLAPQRVGPLYDEIHQALERLVAGEDADQTVLQESAVQATITPSERPLPEFIGLTDLTGLSEEAMRELLEQIKCEHLAWEETTGSAKKWWEAFESENASRIHLVIQLAEQLQMRGAKITEFFLSYVYSNVENIQANLYYLDFERIKKGTADSYFNPEINTFQTALSALDVTEIPDSAFNALLEPLLERRKQELGWEDNDLLVNDLINRWWRALEDRYADKRVLLILLDELQSRREMRKHSYKYLNIGPALKIKDLYDACVHSNSLDLQANLHYLDYLVLKNEEIKRKEGNEDLPTGEASQFTIGKLARDESSHLRLAMYLEQMQPENDSSPVFDFPSPLANDEQTVGESPFFRCLSCRTLLSATAVVCRMCGAELPERPEHLEGPSATFERDEKAGELFESAVDRCCRRLQEYRGEVYDGLVFRAINEGLTSALTEAVKQGVIFDILDVSNRLSKAAKYLVDERDITFHLLARLADPPPGESDLANLPAASGSSSSVPKRTGSQRIAFTEDEFFTFAQVLEQVEQSYGGALDFIGNIWNCKIDTRSSLVDDNVSQLEGSSTELIELTDSLPQER